ncbi:MAG: hypothetical protein ACW991_10395 [Candidatus Hodarchaeales archaeon]|jgi:hypothetical protein
MSKKGLIEKIFCAKFTISLDDKTVDKCAFISASSAAEAWDLTEVLASFWNIDDVGLDASFKIERVYKQPCSKNPGMIWTKQVLNKVWQRVGRKSIEFFE